MSINRLQVKNFKSFKDLDVELGNLNIIIGANASGKSNFINIFRFLRDISTSGLNNAIQLQGGVEYLYNIRIKNDEDVKLSFTFDNDSAEIINEKQSSFNIYKTTIDIDLKINKDNKYEISNERIKQDFEINENDNKKQIISLSLYLTDGKIIAELFKPDQIELKAEDLFPINAINTFISKVNLTQQNDAAFLMLYNVFVIGHYSKTAIFDFNPKMLKMASPSQSKADLEEDGSNLSIVLNNILSDEEKKRKFSNLIKDLLPFVQDLEVENTSDKSLLFKLQEIYTEKEFLPASFLSDGTINITALIIALYFEKSFLTIIEEPERNIHPSLMSRLMEMMKEASKNKQIIITTHNPEIVKYADINDVYLISRDQEGFSQIVKPKDSETVKAFLDNELSIEELYVQNLLES